MIVKKIHLDAIYIYFEIVHLHFLFPQNVPYAARSFITTANYNKHNNHVKMRVIVKNEKERITCDKRTACDGDSTVG